MRVGGFSWEKTKWEQMKVTFSSTVSALGCEAICVGVELTRRLNGTRLFPLALYVVASM